jgi:hypothetical protein
VLTSTPGTNWTNRAGLPMSVPQGKSEVARTSPTDAIAPRNGLPANDRRVPELVQAHDTFPRARR